MKILGIDPSYSSTGFVLFDSELNQIVYNNSVKFNNFSSMNKKEIELWHGLISKNYKEIKYTKIQRKDLTQYWNNIRLYEMTKIIEQLRSQIEWDVVVTEDVSFASSISDVFAITRLASISENGITRYKCYSPKSWQKILFGNGGMKRDVVKAFIKNKIDNFILPNLSEKVNLNSQDEYDALCVILTYMKENKIESLINYNMLLDK